MYVVCACVCAPVCERRCMCEGQRASSDISLHLPPCLRQSLAHHGGIPGKQNFPVSATHLPLGALRSESSSPSPTLHGSLSLNLGPPALQVPYPLNRLPNQFSLLFLYPL